MPFDIPMIWCETQNHFNDCYFYCVNLSLTAIRTGNISYPNVQSTSRPIAHSGSIPVQKKSDYFIITMLEGIVLEGIVMTYALYIKLTTFFHQHRI